MADMDLGLDLEMEGGESMEIENLSIEEQRALETESTETSLAEDLDGFARGFTAAWDLEPPEDFLK